MSASRPWIPYNPAGGAKARWKGHTVRCCVCGTEDVATYQSYGKPRKRTWCAEHFREYNRLHRSVSA